RCLAKVTERGFQCTALVFVQHFAVRQFSHAHQNVEKHLDAAMAIAQHPDRVREIALSLRSDDDGHEFSSSVPTADLGEDRRRVLAGRADGSDTGSPSQSRSRERRTAHKCRRHLNPPRLAQLEWKPIPSRCPGGKRLPLDPALACSATGRPTTRRGRSLPTPQLTRFPSIARLRTVTGEVAPSCPAIVVSQPWSILRRSG